MTLFFQKSFSGLSTVKRGCLNNTDTGPQVGECEETISHLPGSEIPTYERMCLCTEPLCNFSTTSYISLCATFIIFCILYFS